MEVVQTPDLAITELALNNVMSVWYRHRYHWRYSWEIGVRYVDVRGDMIWWFDGPKDCISLYRQIVAYLEKVPN